MTDERAALIEWLAKTCEERYPYRNGETYHEDWRPTDDTVRPVTYGVLRAINAELARLSAEARVLREALEPFAKEALLWPDYVPDSDGVFIASPDDVIPILDEFASLSGRRTAGIQYSDNTVTVGDLRKARAALARAKGEAK